MTSIEAPYQQHAAAIARGARCTECPLYNCGQGPVMPVVVPGAVLTLVGEAPGMTEVENGQIFVGSASEVIFPALLEGGVPKSRVTQTNAILCRPPGGHMLDYAARLKVEHRKLQAQYKANGLTAPPLVTPQECCAPRLHQDIEDSDAKTLLGLGTEGLKAVAKATKLPYATKVAPGTPRVATLKKQHGSPVLVPDGRVVTCAMHPAFVMFGNTTFMPVVKADITRAAVIAMRGGLIDWHEPSFIIKSSIDVCINVLRLMREATTLVTVDIETDGIVVRQARIRCIGLGAVIDGKEVVIAVPLRHMNGRPWWSPGDEARLEHALRELLENAPLNGHNLIFDTAVMIARRILTQRGRIAFDTMVASHDTNRSELPHDLGFVIAREFEAPHHKDDADHKNTENVDDYTLHVYCCKDVLGTMRLVIPLAQQMNQQGTLPQFRTDMALLPAARDMGDLGLCIDEVRRRKFFDILSVAVAQRAAELRRITGIPDFNPNAFKQVARYLYVNKGLSPPYAADGREWSELSDEDQEVEIDTDDPEVIVAMSSTNELSLLRLLELGVDEHTRQFIEAQLSYRGLQKCVSTQVGLKWEEKDGQTVLVDKHRKKGHIQTDSYGNFTGSVLHPSYKIHVVPGGRWAASPNVMAWSERIVWDVELYKQSLAAGWGDKGKPFDPDGTHGIINTRAMVTSPTDHEMTGADYQQVELRIYAIMSGDQLMLDAIYTGKDPHALNFASMQAVGPWDIMNQYEKVLAAKSSVKKYFRNIAKRFGFLEIYGGMPDALFLAMSSDRNPDGSMSFPGLTMAMVKVWHANWHRSHPETKRWQESVVRAWTQHGFVASLIDGRKRFFIGGLDPNAIANHTVQGSSAAITNRAMITIAKECPHRGWSPMSGPVLQVHDFIALQHLRKHRERAQELLKHAMPWKHNGMDFGIDLKTADSWDQL